LERLAWTLGPSDWSQRQSLLGRFGADQNGGSLRVDVGPILKVFDALMTAGATLGLGATGFFVMLAGYQYMSAGGSVRTIESAKSSLYNALIGLAIVIMCKVIAGLVGNALGAPGASGNTTTGIVVGPTTWILGLLS
jgi:hypothetical protein